MTERKTDPPRPAPPRTPGTGHHRLSPDEYEIKIRWEKARRVIEVTSIGVKFEFNSGLKVGVMYPITLNAPGVSVSTTLEVSRCQLVVASGRFFLVEGRFFPYVE
ncbi:MAG: hypothetical protein M3S32_05130 [Acidobacteriota bacterium]|jgi:hypothetical protein|nr:hypothetical protein [Acidobacteriota bacterium]